MYANRREMCVINEKGSGLFTEIYSFFAALWYDKSNKKIGW